MLFHAIQLKKTFAGQAPYVFSSCSRLTAPHHWPPASQAAIAAQQVTASHLKLLVISSKRSRARVHWRPFWHALVREL